MGRKKNNKSKSSLEVFVGLFIFIILLIVVFLNGQNNINQNNEINNNNVNNASTNTQIFEDKLNVYFIDVGQADSILVSNKNKTMLIDAGNNENGKDVVNFIKEKGITKINYLIGTHPHADHIGGLDDVINSDLEIENIYMPKIQTNTKTFEDVLDAIKNKGLKVTSPKKGDIFKIGDSNCEIMTDSILDEKNLNLSSIIIRLEYGDNSFLFMGDRRN